MCVRFVTHNEFDFAVFAQLEKMDLSRLQNDLTINQDIQTEERNHARFGVWYVACVHVACPSCLYC